MNLRNFSLHGNVDPIREQIETVYFEGRRPLFAEGGDHHLRYFEHLEQIYKPQEVIRDYEFASRDRILPFTEASRILRAGH